ncbi:hypothetical protein DH2020_028110 [Rehmannia glutinosa]|uniref:Uncharacterized protein n=1 Tax=Rehmannia glutinosa TaxID=99300 RepID=A0ABR0VTD4_REHGL
MSEIQEPKSFFKKHWEGYTDFWGERFSFLDNYSRFLYPEKPLPHWDSSVVEEFIASDLIHGPTLKTAREAAKIGAVGAVVGAVSTAGYAWKWSRSPHGAALSFAFGAAIIIFGIIANHWFSNNLLQWLHMVKFYEWLQNRAGG